MKSYDELPDHFRAMIALQAYATGKGTPPQTKEIVATHPFHSSNAETPDHIAYLEGGDVGRYRINWSGSYLHYGPWLAEKPALDRFRGPRLLIREIIGEGNLAIATYADAPYLYNKSVLHILPGSRVTSLEAQAVQMKALLGLLNSETGSFVLSRQGRKTQRKIFPKLVKEDLDLFLVPLCFDGFKEELARLVDVLLDDGSSVGDRKRSENALNELADHMYQGSARTEPANSPLAQDDSFEVALPV